MIVLMLYWFGWSLGFIISQIVNVRKYVAVTIFHTSQLACLFCVCTLNYNLTLHHDVVTGLHWLVCWSRWSLLLESVA